VSASPVSAAMPVTEHLRELRKRLVRSGAAIVAGMVVGWIYYTQLFAWLSKPFNAAVQQAQSEGRTVTLALTGVADPFVLQVQVAAVAGLVLSSPVWLYQTWRFVTPGLHRNERRWSIGFVGVATPLFLGGVLLAYTILPIGLELLLGFTPENVENIVSVDRYPSFFLRTILVFGIGFLAPLLLVVLNFAGILTGKRLASWWRWIIHHRGHGVRRGGDTDRGSHQPHLAGGAHDDAYRPRDPCFIGQRPAPSSPCPQAG